MGSGWRIRAGSPRLAIAAILTVQLHQTLELIGNATINGYLQARYLKTFRHQSTSEISFYFRGWPCGSTGWSLATTMI